MHGSGICPTTPRYRGMGKLGVLVLAWVLLTPHLLLCSSALTIAHSPRYPPTNDILARYPGQDDYISPTRSVWALVGGQASLPCNLSSPNYGDPALLVLWYKNGVHKPIYSYDMRSGPPTHWKHPAHLGTRASFDIKNDALTITRVQGEDEGTYRCRVDFRTSPTLTYTTNLTVIVPPSRLSVYTDLGAEARSVVGPYVEGDTLRLTCQASGGSPSPRVVWWEDSARLDMTQELEELGQVSNMLVVPQLSRRDLHRTLTCKAGNTNLSDPLITSVTLDMNFPPLWVRLVTNREPLSAGRAYDIECQSVGARPPAIITWRLGKTRLTSHSDKTSTDGNITISILRWTPSVTDSDKALSCQAESSFVHASPLIDEWLLNIYYIPKVTLKPGRSLNLSNIEEGDDVYFECYITANPAVYKITWLHQDKELQHNVTAGVIISNQSLVLQSVARTASGDYYCIASNIEGDGRSNPTLLRVKYAPVCRSNQMTYHGAARFEQVNIPCHLDAHPKPTSFRWTFNNSGESVEIPKDHILEEGWRSIVSYTPNTELDYGTLLCWGGNTVGSQRRPCVFHVFPAGHPDPVHNCSVYNLSVSVVNVRCVAGFDGGLPQTFILELYDPHSNALLSNVTNGIPKFSVGSLPPGLPFSGVVYSTNSKGQSERVTLQVYTIKDDVAERRTAAVKPPPGHPGQASVSSIGLQTILAVVLGVVGGVLLVVVGVCAVLQLKYRRNHTRQSEPLSSRDVLSEPDKSVCQAKIQQAATPVTDLPPPTSCVGDTDERNPDVIPQSDSDSWTGEGVTTISSAALPTTYTTLPRTAHSHNRFQECGGSGDARYTQLLMTTGGISTPTTRPRRPQQVLYATLDHHQRPLSKPYPQPQPSQGFPQPPSGSPNQAHLLFRPQPAPVRPHHTALRPQAVQPQEPSPWTPSMTLGRRHSLRKDPRAGDPEASVPLMTSQKESSV